MTNPWDQFPKPTSSGAYFELKNPGDSFEGTIVRIESSKPFEEVVPRVVFDDEEGGTKHYDFTNTVLRNAIITLEPQPGQRIRVTKLPKPKGATYFDGKVELVGAASESRADTVSKAAPAATEELPPF